MAVPGAAHTPALQPQAELLRQRLQGLRPQATQIPFYSTQLARRCAGEELNANYWADSIHRPVRFAEVVQQLLREQFETYLELGPQPSLTSAITQNGRVCKRPVMALPSCARQQPDLRALAIALGKLHGRGVAIAWQRMYQGDPTNVTLPHYPWQRERCWVNVRETKAAGHSRGNGSVQASGGSANGTRRTTIPQGNGTPSQPEESTDSAPARRPTNSQVATSAAPSALPAATPSDATPSLTDVPAPAPSNRAQQIGLLPEEQREAALTAYLCEQLGYTFQVDPDTIALQEPLTQMGFDSLMALELKNRVEHELKVKISVRSFLEGPTIAGLVTLLLPQLSAPADEDTALSEVVARVIEDMSPEEAVEFAEKLESMSDQEIEEFITRRFAASTVAQDDEHGERGEKGEQV